jgi:hypothetical protein
MDSNGGGGREMPEMAETPEMAGEEGSERVPSNPLQSVWSVLFSPESTFRSLAVRPRWLPALLVLLLSAFAVSIVLTPKMDMKQAIVDALEKQGRELTPTQLDQQVNLMKKVGMGAQIVLQPAFYLLAAVVFFVILRLLGSEIDYRRSLSVTVHGMLPLVIGALLMIPVVMSRASVSVEEVQGSRLLKSNLAALAPDSVGTVGLALLSSIDIFTLWSVFLLAVGYRIVGKVSGKAAWGTVLVLWAVAIGFKLAMAAIS